METYVSGPGFAYIYNLKNNKQLDSHQIIEKINEGDDSAILAIREYVDHLSRGLSNVINILDPDIIVLGGGMSNINYIYKNINSVLRKYVVSDFLHTKVVKNKHGDSSGVRGAAWL